MIAEVFLLGHWKDYNELEETLSMPELLLTLDAQRKVKYRDYKFQAALKGVSLPDAGEEQKGSGRSFEEIERDAIIRAQGGDPESGDVVELTGAAAENAGFGIDVEGGLTHSVY
jgi:hypothetical protein